MLFRGESLVVPSTRNDEASCLSGQISLPLGLQSLIARVDGVLVVCEYRHFYMIQKPCYATEDTV